MRLYVCRRFVYVCCDLTITRAPYQIFFLKHGTYLVLAFAGQVAVANIFFDDATDVAVGSTLLPVGEEVSLP
jgi:hypothetical protein